MNDAIAREVRIQLANKIVNEIDFDHIRNEIINTLVDNFELAEARQYFEVILLGESIYSFDMTECCSKIVSEALASYLE